MVDTGANTEEITAERTKLMNSIRRGLDVDDRGDETVSALVSTAIAVDGDAPQTEGNNGKHRFLNLFAMDSDGDVVDDDVVDDDDGD